MRGAAVQRPSTDALDAVALAPPAVAVAVEVATLELKGPRPLIH
jgi:hypothetical protein